MEAAAIRQEVMKGQDQHGRTTMNHNSYKHNTNTNTNKKSSTKNNRMRSCFVVILALLVWSVFVATEVLQSARTPFASAWQKKSRNVVATTTTTTTTPLIPTNNDIITTSIINAATGERFQGSKVRDYYPGKHHHLRFSNTQHTIHNKAHEIENKQQLSQFLQQQPLYQQCDKWAVVTTIYEPSDAVKIVGNELTDWCLVIVADTKTPTNYMETAGWNSNNTTSSGNDTNDDNHRHKVIFLSVSDQQELSQWVPFVAQTPFRSFARKNIGYLYAIWMGAQIIFDFDDDNLVRNSSLTDQNKMFSGTELLEVYSNPHVGGHNNLMVRHVSISDDYKGRAFNPFPIMGATEPDTWPRGLPLDLIKDKSSRGQFGPLMLQEIPRSSIAVIQSTCDHDPDVDAIYRLNRPLPFSFDKSRQNAHTVQVPSNLYAPYNAQATLHYSIAFWGLYLPMSVTGRVSDIWRSYIVQRLLQELPKNVHVLYTPPLVTQFRNSHDYVGDFAAEEHLYLRTDALLQFLDEWKPKNIAVNGEEEDNDKETSLPSRIEDLWIQLYERQYVELVDVQAVQEWLHALEQGGYSFPTARKHHLVIPDPSTGGVEARQECARQRLAHWKEPKASTDAGFNFGAYTFASTNSNNVSVARLLAGYEVEHPFPHSIDLVCRTGAKHAPHEMTVLIESIQLYWPKCVGRILLVLDRGDEDFAREHIPSWIDVMFSQFDYGMPGRLGNQLFNMYSDQQGRSDYVAIIDADVALTTPVTPDLIFNMDKIDPNGNAPLIIMTETQYQKGFWSKGDNWMFQGDSNDWNFMITLPQVFPRKMFPQYRAGVEAIHGNQFETTDLWEHFRRTVKLGWMGMSQFALLGNWLVRHWTDTPFDLRNETAVPPIRYGVHLPYFRGLSFQPGGKKDPASFQRTGSRVISDGLCELFCSPPSSETLTVTMPAAERDLESENVLQLPKLEVCPSLCPAPIAQPREMYFKYESIVYGTPDERHRVVEAHFQPLKKALAKICSSIQ